MFKPGRHNITYYSWEEVTILVNNLIKNGCKNFCFEAEKELDSVRCVLIYEIPMTPLEIDIKNKLKEEQEKKWKANKLRTYEALKKELGL